MSSRDSPEQPQNASRPSRRTAQACAPCRLSKTKCNGQDPCARCKDRGIVCMPGMKRRKPARKLILPCQDTNPKMGVTTLETSESADQADLLKREVHCSITGSEASESSAMNLHYGPSSTFVFLQQLHRFLVGAQAPKQSTINGRSTNYTAEAISEFGYSSIFFGKEPDNSDSSGTQQGNFQPGYAPELLSFDLAATFLEMYLSTVHHVFLFCEQATLRKLFYNLYSATPNSPQNSRDSAMVMAALSLGAILSYHPIWADSLYRKAKATLNSWGDAVSLRSVQISMLLSEYHQSQGRPNSSMLAIGRAVQKAFAVGLHRDMPSQGVTKDIAEADLSRTRERQATFWSLYAQDRNLSLSLGRPASINDLDINIPDPTWDHSLMAAVKLSRISYKVYYNIYGRNRGSIPDFCRKVQDIYDEMISFHKSLPMDQKFPLSKAELKQYSVDFSTSQMVLAFHFFQTMITTLRPCLVLDAARRQSMIKFGDQKSVIPSEWVSWLRDAAEWCRKASVQIINLFSQAIESNSFMSSMRHSRFFIEGACFALLFDVIRDPTRDGCEINFQAVAEGLHCFARLPTDRLLMISTFGVSQILELTEQLVAKAKGEAKQKFDKGQDGTQDCGPTAEPWVQRPLPTDSTNECIGAGRQAQATGSMDELGLCDDAGNVFPNIFDNNIFDMSYYLWCEDPNSLNVG